MELPRFKISSLYSIIMAVTGSEVEHGSVVPQQNEKGSQDLTFAQVESLSPEVPEEDVVTLKTWIVVLVSMPCHTVVQ